MQIHQIIHHPTLQIILYPIDNHLAPHIDDLAVRQIALVLIQRLVHPLIHPNPLPKILRRSLRILALVIRARGLDIADIAHNQLLVIALTFDE